MFVKGKLYFIVSVVPSTLTTVTKTVVVDAQTNTAIKDFDTTAQGLQDTLDFLKNGPDGASAPSDAPATTPDQPSAAPAPTTPRATTPQGTTPPSRAELQRRIDQAIERQQQTIEDLRALQQELERTR